MSKDPAVLFYTSDFLTGVSFMSMEERGQYITLLCQQHQFGSIPESHLINTCKSLDSLVAKKFKRLDDGNYVNMRMYDEGRKRRNYIKGRQKNLMGNHMDSHMENENENEDEDENTNYKTRLHNKDDKKRHIFIKPNIIDISNYNKERKNNINAEAFYDFYESKGWMIGKNKMKDWKAAVRNWEKRERSYQLTNAQKHNLEGLKKFNERMDNEERNI